MGALTLDVRDFGGDRRFRGVWPAYYNTVHGLVFVVGLFDEQCLTEACELLWWVLGVCASPDWLGAASGSIGTTGESQIE